MVNSKHRPRPVALIILDGWGYSESERGNAILAAHKPNWDRLWAQYPHTLIQGSGSYVGLPPDQMGNSEVGHLNMGAGRVVYQEITRIDRAIRQGEFQRSPVLVKALEQAERNGRDVHVIGLLSDGGVHSRQDHIHAMLRLAVERWAAIGSICTPSSTAVTRRRAVPPATSRRSSALPPRSAAAISSR